MLMHAPKVALEIGTHYGFTTAHMIRAAQTYGGKVITMDVADQRDRSLLGLPHSFILGDSLHALNNPEVGGVEFCFVDGNHGPIHFAKELAILKEKLTPQCVVVIHDTILYPRIREASEQFAKSEGFGIVTLRTPNHPKKVCDSTGLSILSK